MNTQIKLYNKNNQLHLTVYKLIKQKEKIHLNTSNQKLISKFINGIKSPIIFADFINEDTFKIQLEDKSAIIIHQYSLLKDELPIKSLIKKLKQFEKIKKGKKNFTKVAMISFGMFLGFSHLSKNLVLAKNQNILVSLTMK